MQNNRIPKNIRQVLIEKCDQEDIQSLNVRCGKDRDFTYFIKKELIRMRNRFLVDFANKFEAPFMSVFLTQRCTLQCVNCSDLIPYYRKPENFDCGKVLFCLKKYLTVVDSVHFFLLCGGETFLYPELGRILQFCIQEKKIRKIGIVTNGTIIPSDELCELMANPKVRVRVSAYKCVREKRKSAIEHLKKRGVLVEDLEGQKWYDVGGFEKRGRNKRQLEQIFQQCSMNKCFEINKNKVIYCARQRGGELGLVPQMPTEDYVSLKIKDSDTLRNQLLHMYDKRFLAACDYCDGITSRSRQIVPGEQ